LGIHNEAPKAIITAANFNSQHPSWNTDANVFLARIMQKTIPWKQAKTKLILMIAEGPRHAVLSPDS